MSTFLHYSCHLTYTILCMFMMLLILPDCHGVPSLYAEKLASGDDSQRLLWELTNVVPLNDDGSSVEAVLGNNPDVHYIYVCIKVGRTHFYYWYDIIIFGVFYSAKIL